VSVTVSPHRPRQTPRGAESESPTLSDRESGQLTVGES
jgi:hypothetical protein